MRRLTHWAVIRPGGCKVKLRQEDGGRTLRGHSGYSVGLGIKGQTTKVEVDGGFECCGAIHKAETSDCLDAWFELPGLRRW